MPKGLLSPLINIYEKIINIFFWSNNGLHFGVIVFVVMSGFLIHRTSRFTSKNEYLVKRIIRIYPLFFIASFTGLYVSDFKDIYSYMLNISLLTSVIPNNGPPGNPILITVIVEIVIYILYIYLRKFNTYKILFFLFFIYIFNFIIYLNFNVNSTYVQRNLFSLILYWYIGAGACQFFIEENRNINIKYLILSYFGYTLISNFIYIKGLHYLYSILFALIASVFIATIFKKDFNINKNEKIKKIWILNKLGEAAYSIYAWHSIVIFIFQKKEIQWNTENYLLVILIIVLISFSSYYFIEKYFNKKRFDLINYFNHLND